ncbi:MAG: SpoIID/LytB domain-containing protein [Acidimicrobiales bacterium]
MNSVRSRGSALAVLCAALTLGVGIVPAALATPAPSVPVVHLDGTGFGHGVGLSQWGAEYLARTGRTAEEILGTFYPGVQLAEATGPVRVAVLRAGSGATTVSFPQGGEVRSPADGPQADGFPVRVGPGDRVRIAHDGQFRVTPLVGAQASAATPYQEPCALLVLCPPSTAPSTTSTTTVPGSGGPSAPATTAGGGGPSGPGAPPSSGGGPTPAGTASSAQPVVAVPTAGGVTTVDDRGRSYRGAVEAVAGGGLRLVNLVDVEDYLRGMAEVPGTWPAAAVQAQTIAARTYALRAVQASGEICDDARCQVYVGVAGESPGQDAAVAASARRVLVYQGALAAAVYSADAGGVSATTFEGFGTPDGVYPYLRATPYETDNPLPWSQQVALVDLERRFGYPGTVTGARVADTGPSGRALTVVLEGSAGDRPVDGRSFARSLGLRSTRFTMRATEADQVPALPEPEESEVQALPEEAGTIAREIRAIDDGALGPVAFPSPAPTADERDGAGRPSDLLAIAGLLLVSGVLGLVTGSPALAGRPDGARAWPRWRRPDPSR